MFSASFDMEKQKQRQKTLILPGTDFFFQMTLPGEILKLLFPLFFL
jgi:hypothetical protein